MFVYITPKYTDYYTGTLKTEGTDSSKYKLFFPDVPSVQYFLLTTLELPVHLTFPSPTQSYFSYLHSYKFGGIYVALFCQSG